MKGSRLMFQDKHWRFPHRTCSFIVAKPSNKSSNTRLVYFDSGYNLRWNFVSLFYLIKSKKKWFKYWLVQILTWLVLIVVLNKNFPKLASVFIPSKNLVQRSKKFLLCPAQAHDIQGQVQKCSNWHDLQMPGAVKKPLQ